MLPLFRNDHEVELYCVDRPGRHKRVMRLKNNIFGYEGLRKRLGNKGVWLYYKNGSQGLITAGR